MITIPLNTVLHTDRLRLRSTNASDIDLAWSASRYPGFNDGMVWDPPNHPDELIPVTEKNIQAWEQGTCYTFTIEYSDSLTPVGRIALRFNTDTQTGDIGYWIHPEYQGQGLATEAAREILRFGYDVLGAVSMTTAHATWNRASKRVIEKLGFTLTGENPCGFEKQGKSVAEYEYKLEKQDYLASS